MKALKIILSITIISFILSCKKDNADPVTAIPTGQIIFFESNYSQHINYDWTVVYNGTELGHINYCSHSPSCDTTGYTVLEKPAGNYDITFRSYSGLNNQTRTIEIKANECKKYDWVK